MVGIVKRVAVAVLLLGVVGVAGCGGDVPEAAVEDPGAIYEAALLAFRDTWAKKGTLSATAVIQRVNDVEIQTFDTDPLPDGFTLGEGENHMDVNDVRESLMKHGVSSEYGAVRALMKAGWWANMSPTYFDRDGGKTREYDIAATLPDLDLDPELDVEPGDGAQGRQRVVVALACEVKYAKPEEPWVVIRPTGLGLPIPRMPTCWPPAKAASLAEFLKGREHPLVGSGCGTDAFWTGAGVVEPKFKPGGNQRRATSFVAIEKVCKASEDLLQFHVERTVPRTRGTFAAEPPPPPAEEAPGLILVKPVVVVAGPLFSCSVDESGDLVVVEARAGQVMASYRSKEYAGLGQVVDVVRLDYLTEYGACVKRLRRNIAESWLVRDGSGG